MTDSDAISMQIVSPIGDKVGDLISTGIDNNFDPAIVALNDGGWVVTYTNIDPAGSDTVSGKIYNADGTVRTSDFLIGQVGDNVQSAVTALQNGNWAVVYTDTEDTGLSMHIFDPNGVDLSTAIKVDIEADQEVDPNIAVIDNGFIVVSWTQPGSSSTIMARVFDETGDVVPINGSTSPFLMSTLLGPPLYPDSDASLSALPGGRFITTWADEMPDSSGGSIRAAIKEIKSTTTGDDADNIIEGDGLDNTIFGGNGDDTLYGITGKDSLSGGFGNDTLFGGAESDLLRGQGGMDILKGGAGDDTLRGDEGNDILEGQEGNDTLFGDEGNDILKGGAGDDRLFTSSSVSGNDKMYGGAGDDFLLADNGENEMNGGGGNDRIFGGSDRDIIHGDGGKDEMEGRGGSDIMNGGNGDDRMHGGDGDDTLNGGNGNDRMLGGDGDDTLNGDSGNDELRGDDGDDVLRGGDGNDQVFGSFGNDRVLGNAGDDFLYGRADDDFLHGGAGKDFLDGGSGNDILRGGGSQDIFRLVDGFTSVRIADFQNDVDTIRMDEDIWNGGLTVDELLSTYGTQLAAKTYILDFGATQIEIFSANAFTENDLKDDILLF